MSYSNNEQLYRQIIMDHYQLPRHKGLVTDDGYDIIHLKNPSCGDDLMIQVKLADQMIEDIRFEGTGCAICCASSSMLTEAVHGKSIVDAIEYIRSFSEMMIGKDINETILGEAVSMQGVAKLPPRIKCATLSHKALEQALVGKEIELGEGVESVIK